MDSANKHWPFVSSLVFHCLLTQIYCLAKSFWHRYLGLWPPEKNPTLGISGYIQYKAVAGAYRLHAITNYTVHTRSSSMLLLLLMSVKREDIKRLLFHCLSLFAAVLVSIFRWPSCSADKKGIQWYLSKRIGCTYIYSSCLCHLLSRCVWAASCNLSDSRSRRNISIFEQREEWVRERETKGLAFDTIILFWWSTWNVLLLLRLLLVMCSVAFILYVLSRRQCFAEEKAGGIFFPNYRQASLHHLLFVHFGAPFLTPMLLAKVSKAIFK